MRSPTPAWEKEQARKTSFDDELGACHTLFSLPTTQFLQKSRFCCFLEDNGNERNEAQLAIPSADDHIDEEKGVFHEIWRIPLAKSEHKKVAWPNRHRSRASVVFKACMVAITPMPLVVLGSYGIRHSDRKGFERAEQWLRNIVVLAAPLLDPGGIMFFIAALVSTFFLASLWLDRKAANASSLTLTAVAAFPALVGLAGGLEPLIVAFCILPFSVYATIICHDVSV